MTMIERHKTYIGTYKTEEEASWVYDKFTILIQGANAKTNHSYTKREVLEILRLGNFV